MRIALVQDRLCDLGGSERVFQYICEAFPDADIFTLTFDARATLPYFGTRKIHTTWLNPFVRSSPTFRLAFPLATYVMEGLKLSGYDLVLSSSATVAKYVTVQTGKHVCYCYIPTRAIWHPAAFFDHKRLRSKAFNSLLPYLRRRDYAAAQRIDHFIAISDLSREYIRLYYDRNAEVIPCPIDLNMFYASRKKKDYYLLVSRLEYWKRVDYAVEAFNQLGLPLHVVGRGEEEPKLRKMAKANIVFLGALSDPELAREYSEALAVVFTPHLEYGLIPLEANASGTPVICYGRGGVCETMVPLSSPGIEPATAVFFYEQTASALVDAVRQFQKCEFNSCDLVKHASKWAVPTFRERIRKTAFAALGNHSYVPDACPTA